MGRSVFRGEPVRPLPAATAQVSLPAHPGVSAAAMPGPRAHAGGAVPADDCFCWRGPVKVRLRFMSSFYLCVCVCILGLTWRRWGCVERGEARGGTVMWMAMALLTCGAFLLARQQDCTCAREHRTSGGFSCSLFRGFGGTALIDKLRCVRYLGWCASERSRPAPPVVLVLLLDGAGSTEFVRVASPLWTR